jgi:hypothetical protein
MTRKKTNRPTLIKDDVEKVGDKIVITKVWETPAVVKFDDLVEACEVEPDNDFREPWKEHDGYEHDFRKIEYPEHDDMTLAAGWVSSRRGYGSYVQSGLIVLDDNCEDTYQHYRALGYSKQVARERQAESKKRLLAQIARWYREGWYVYQVVCEFRDYSESLCGILVDEEFDDYLDEVKVEMAYEVAGQMEDHGYVIEGKPDWPDPFNEWYSKVNGHRVTQGLITRDRMRSYWEEHVRVKLLPSEAPTDGEAAETEVLLREL